MSIGLKWAIKDLDGYIFCSSNEYKDLRQDYCLKTIEMIKLYTHITREYAKDLPCIFISDIEPVLDILTKSILNISNSSKVTAIEQAEHETNLALWNIEKSHEITYKAKIKYKYSRNYHICLILWNYKI